MSTVMLYIRVVKWGEKSFTITSVSNTGRTETNHQTYQQALTEALRALVQEQAMEKYR